MNVVRLIREEERPHGERLASLEAKVDSIKQQIGWLYGLVAATLIAAITAALRAKTS